MDEFFVRNFFWDRHGIFHIAWTNIFLKLTAKQMAQLALEMAKAAYLPPNWIKDGEFLLEKAFVHVDSVSTEDLEKIESILDRFSKNDKAHHFGLIFDTALLTEGLVSDNCNTDKLQTKIECLLALFDFFNSFRTFDIKIRNRVVKCVTNWRTYGLSVERCWQKHPRQFVADLIAGKIISTGYDHLAKSRSFHIHPDNMKKIYDFIVGQGFSFFPINILHVRFGDDVIRTLSINVNTCEVKLKK